MKKETEKLQPKQFKDCSSNWWIAGKHYHLSKDNEILFVAGGLEIEAETDFLRQFIKRNKKTFTPREKVSVVEYFEVIDFGIHKGRKVDEVEKKYLNWMIKNYNFAGKEKLKAEIINVSK